MPRVAYQRLQDGWVCVGFDITARGHIENTRIVASYPQRLYESAALAAASRWLFTPGEPVEDVRAVFRFKFR
ncbi:MAG: TonB family protein [Deltaproteobacteria bacterium]